MTTLNLAIHQQAQKTMAQPFFFWELLMTAATVCICMRRRQLKEKSKWPLTITKTGPTSSKKNGIPMIHLASDICILSRETGNLHLALDFTILANQQMAIQTEAPKRCQLGTLRSLLSKSMSAIGILKPTNLCGQTTTLIAHQAIRLCCESLHVTRVEFRKRS